MNDSRGTSGRSPGGRRGRLAAAVLPLLHLQQEPKPHVGIRALVGEVHHVVCACRRNGWESDRRGSEQGGWVKRLMHTSPAHASGTRPTHPPCTSTNRPNCPPTHPPTPDVVDEAVRHAVPEVRRVPQAGEGRGLPRAHQSCI